MRETEIGVGGPGFSPTLWTQVLRAGDGARDALNALFDIYWKPVYFFVRRKGRSIEDAKDLTQGFFASLLERNSLAKVDRQRGKFRSWLLGALEHFLADDRDRRNAAKRRAPEVAAAEPEYRPESTFEKDWATAVLGRAYAALEAEDGRAAAVARAMMSKRAYAEVARELGISEGNVQVIAHRARKRLRELILRELSATVASPAEAEAELADLFRAFSL